MNHINSFADLFLLENLEQEKYLYRNRNRYFGERKFIPVTFTVTYSNYIYTIFRGVVKNCGAKQLLLMVLFFRCQWFFLRN